MKKNFFLTLSIIFFIISISVLFSNKYILYITPFNRKEFLNEISQDEIKYKNLITKVELSTGADSGHLTIIYLFIIPYKTFISEGVFKYDNLQLYLFEHAINLYKLSIIYLLFSILNFFIFFHFKKQSIQ